MLASTVLFATLLAAILAHGQAERPAWQTQVLQYSAANDWDAALRVVDQEIARAPHDMDVRAWRARVLASSGRLAEAQTEYLAILKVTPKDPDDWAGLASVYLREGKTDQALGALETAVRLDPARADLHAAYARALRAAGERDDARLEFQRALDLNPASEEARTGIISVRAATKHELRFGQGNDLFNFTSANHGEWTSLVSRWSPHWATLIAGSFYQIGGTGAGKFVGSATARASRWGAITVGGAIADDNAVIPKSEFFFDLDHGWKTRETSFVRGVEFVYAQHWYWYQSSRILTLTGTSIFYLPRDWTLAVGATGARSAFPGTAAEWQPSGIARVGFPLKGWSVRRLSGSLFFAVGTEDFAQINQIGSFSSQTYGGGLTFQITQRQDFTGFVSYQKRTQDRTDTGIGISYGTRF